MHKQVEDNENVNTLSITQCIPAATVTEERLFSVARGQKIVFINAFAAMVVKIIDSSCLRVGFLQSDPYLEAIEKMLQVYDGRSYNQRIRRSGHDWSLPQVC